MVSWYLGLAASDNDILLPPKAADEIKALLSSATVIIQSIDEELTEHCLCFLIFGLVDRKRFYKHMLIRSPLHLIGNSQTKFSL